MRSAIDTDTIAAVATAAGAAGIGIIRISGPACRQIAAAICAATFEPGRHRYVRFRDAQGDVLDDGLLLAFAAPHSFTGEDVIELQAHGSAPVLRLLLARVCELGGRQARAGEFTERAFLNGRLDLVQAEALADLISAGNEAAARAARRSLDGVFSQQVDAVVEHLTGLRVFVEAAIDFPDEEIDFLASDELAHRLQTTLLAMDELLRQAERGQRVRDGLHAVILGAPNAGKSSLLNRLAGADRAIVTEMPGTTRDLLRETLRIHGIELTLVDTAGLRQSEDPVEKEGMRRARAELAGADLVLAVIDDRMPEQLAQLRKEIPEPGPRVLWLHNKIDLSAALPAREECNDGVHLFLSASTGDGVELLRAELAEAAGHDALAGGFSARQRHVDALRQGQLELLDAERQLRLGAGELAAEALRLAQDRLGEITGRITPDQLLGRVFSSFCIGK